MMSDPASGKRAAAWIAIGSGALVIAVIVLGIFVREGAPALLELNRDAAAYVTSFRGAADGAVIFITSIGNPLPLTIICVIFAALLIAFRKRRDALIFAITMIVAVAVAHLLKAAFGIERPQGDALVALPASASYPSAHSTCALTAFALMGLILLRLVKESEQPRALGYVILIALVLLAVVIGISRIYVAVHWATDIIGGFMLAIAILLPAGYMLFAPRETA